MEDLMLSLFVCLIIPIAMAMLVLKDRSRVLLAFMLVGIFMCLFAGQVNGLIAQASGLSTPILTTTVTPVVEEIVKIIPVIVLAFVIKADRQYLIECALMIGLGFATMENVYILMNNAAGISFGWALSRGLGAAMLHAVCSLIVAYGISYCSLRKKTFITGSYAMLLSAMVLHGIYNMLVQSEKYFHFGLLLPSIIFVAIAIYNSKWLKSHSHKQS